MGGWVGGWVGRWVGVHVCVFLFKCACMWVHLYVHAHRKVLDRQVLMNEQTRIKW